ncbi:terminase [Spartinivicinus marinus]|nr:terminase [Spartinivicinus marinus]MCX4030412.1 terminase [Spartinivicinus marinus]
MAKRKTALSSPEYPAYVARYRHDWERLALDVCGMHLTHQQCPLAFSIQQEGCRVSVSSGHGTGKSSLLAMLIIAFMTTYPKARVVITANKVEQVKIGIFKYLADYWQKAVNRFPWLDEVFTLTAEQFYAVGFQKSWSVGIKGYRLGNEEALAGEHADHLLYIVDEASGLSDKAFDYITGALTQTDNRLVLLSQPTRITGYFYESHHSLAKTSPDDHGFTAFQLNSEESPLVTQSYIVEKVKQYGGRQSPEYCIRVLGAFTKQAEGMLIGRDDVDRGFINEVEHRSEWGYIAIADIAGGEGRDSSVLNILKVSGFDDERVAESVKLLEMNTGVDGVEFAEIVEKETQSYPNITIGVDADGYGLITAQTLEKRGIDVIRIHWGTPVHSKTQKIRFRSKRDFASVMVKEALRDNRLRLNDHYSVKQKTLNQFVKIPYKFNEVGQWRIESKEKMRAEGIKSPDIFDTYAMAWLVDYIPAGMELDHTNSSDELLAWAKQSLSH